MKKTLLKKERNGWEASGNARRQVPYMTLAKMYSMRFMVWADPVSMSVVTKRTVFQRVFNFLLGFHIFSFQSKYITSRKKCSQSLIKLGISKYVHVF